MPISKTDFLRALQCKKMLWLDSHMPEQKMIPPETQKKLDAGNEFGDKAMGIFGPFIETTSFHKDGRLDFASMIEKTRLLVDSEFPSICEAAFSWYGNFCAVDILRFKETGYAMYEVKNAYDPRPEFIVDLGFQRFILRKCEVNLLGSYLVLRGDEPLETALKKDAELKKQATHGCVQRIFHDGVAYKIVNVTTAAKTVERMAEKRIFEFGKLKRKDAEMPCVQPGKQCDKPYRCWYYEFCHGASEQNV